VRTTGPILNLATCVRHNALTKNNNNNKKEKVANTHSKTTTAATISIESYHIIMSPRSIYTVGRGSVDEALNTVDSVKGFGFYGTHCSCCGIDNASLGGRLMQCSRCKKAWFCGPKCFRKYAIIHETYCLKRQVMLEEIASSSSAAPKNDKTKEEEEADIVAGKIAAIISNKADVVAVTKSDQDDNGEEKEESAKKMLSSLSSSSKDEKIVKKSKNLVPPPPPSSPKEPSKESVSLNKAIQNSNEYGWEKPSWVIRSPLKTTEKGLRVKAGQDIIRSCAAPGGL